MRIFGIVPPYQGAPSKFRTIESRHYVDEVIYPTLPLFFLRSGVRRRGKTPPLFDFFDLSNKTSQSNSFGNRAESRVLPRPKHLPRLAMSGECAPERNAEERWTYGTAPADARFNVQTAFNSHWDILMRDWGLRLPMASAILTVLFPEEFTVYDQRVCGSLSVSRKVFGQRLAGLRTIQGGSY
jgi:hypothetical protein